MSHLIFCLFCLQMLVLGAAYMMGIIQILENVEIKNDLHLQLCQSFLLYSCRRFLGMCFFVQFYILNRWESSMLNSIFMEEPAGAMLKLNSHL